MKKNSIRMILALVLATMLMLAFTACGGGGNDDGGGNGGGNNNQPDQNALTSATWQSALQEKYGFTLTAPSGWTFSAGSKGSTFYVSFTIEAEDFDEAYESFVLNIFDQTAAITDGNYEHALWPNVKTAEYDEVPRMFGIVFPIWYFNTATQSIQMSINDNETAKTARISPLSAESGPATKPDGTPPGEWDGDDEGEGWPDDIFNIIFPNITIPEFSSSASGFEWRFSYFGYNSIYITATGATEAMRTAYTTALTNSNWTYSSLWGQHYKSGIKISIAAINEGKCEITITNLNY